jgi:NAD+ synthase
MIDLRFDEEELVAVRATIVGFIRDTVENANAEGAVLGLSGGIDSTLTAHLALEALGADGLRGLILPGAVTDEANVGDAEAIARDLGIEYDVVPIDPIVAAVAESLPGGTAADWAIGNARARVRGVLNYFVANPHYFSFAPWFFLLVQNYLEFHYHYF